MLVFKDAECTTGEELARERRVMSDLCEPLRTHHPIPHVAGLVFNPMTEGAFRLIPEDSTSGQKITDLAKDARLLGRLRRDRRNGQPIDRDRLYNALPVRSNKGDLDAIAVDAATEAGWGRLSDFPASSARESLTRCLRAAGVALDLAGPD